MPKSYIFKFRKIAHILIVLALVTTLAACNGPQSTLVSQSDTADVQRDLLVFVFIMATIVFVLVEGLIMFIVIRYRRRNNQLPKQVEGNKKLEIIWTIIPAIIIVVLAVPTISAIWGLAEDPCDDGNCLEIDAIGHRWWFEYRYPTKEVVTANELYLPTGVPIKINLHSQDVIHSFWVPRLAGKVDMVPTKDNWLSFTIDEPGVYEGQCAELCGLEHTKMKFRVIALLEDDFNKWVDDWFRPPSDSVASMAGAAVFAANCSTCHTTNSYSFGGYAAEIENQDNRWNALVSACPKGLTTECGRSVGIASAPNLTHFGDRTSIAAAWQDLNYDNLVEWIENPASIKGNTYMQSFAAVYNTENSHANLTDQEVVDLANYLLALTPDTTNR